MFSQENLENRIIYGDCLSATKKIADETFHLTFTSPPYYNAKSYAQYASYNDYLDFLLKIFTEVHRITKEGRFLVINTSPVIEERSKRNDQSHRYPIPFDLTYLLSRNGWEFIDDIIWEKPDGSAKNRIAGFEKNRKPITYKPNNVIEYLIVFRKKTDRLIDWNLRQYSDHITSASRVKHYERTNIWKIAPQYDSVHEAVFPIQLCNYIISKYSFIGDLILDPFGGSGTVGRSAIQLRRYFTLIEYKTEYVKRSYQLIKRHENKRLSSYLNLSESYIPKKTKIIKMKQNG